MEKSIPIYEFFTIDELQKLYQDEKIKIYSPETLNNKFINLHTFLSNKELTDEEIKRNIIYYPRILTFDITTLKTNYNSLRKIFKGSTKRLITKNLRLLSTKSDYIKEKILTISNPPFANNPPRISIPKVKQMCTSCPNLLLESNEAITETLKYINTLVKDEEKTITIFKENPRIIGLSQKTIDSKLEWFKQKGYTNEEIIRIISKNTKIFTYDFNQNGNIDIKYNFLKSLGYKEEQIILLTTRFPEIYSMSITTIQERLNLLTTLGFHPSIVKIMFYNFPQIISFTQELIQEKYDYYNSLNMLDIFIKDPKYLMQSIELTESRRQYLTSRNIEVSNYKKLFVSNKRFKKNYGVTNEDVLRDYPNDLNRKKEQYEKRRIN